MFSMDQANSPTNSGRQPCAPNRGWKPRRQRGLVFIFGRPFREVFVDRFQNLFHFLDEDFNGFHHPDRNHRSASPRITEVGARFGVCAGVSATTTGAAVSSSPSTFATVASSQLPPRTPLSLAASKISSSVRIPSPASASTASCVSGKPILETIVLLGKGASDHGFCRIGAAFLRLGN